MENQLSFQARVAQALADTSWTYGHVTIDRAIAHACGYRGMPVQEREYSMAHTGRDYGVILSREQDKESTRLGKQYAQEFANWDWLDIVAAAKGNAEPDSGSFGADEDQLIGRTFLGTVMSLAPSGKYYMPWCTNQTEMDEIRDGAYFEALDTAAETAGGWIESGEGDPCDLFFCMHVDVETDTDDTARHGGDQS